MGQGVHVFTSMAVQSSMAWHGMAVASSKSEDPYRTGVWLALFFRFLAGLKPQDTVALPGGGCVQNTAPSSDWPFHSQGLVVMT